MRGSSVVPLLLGLLLLLGDRCTTSIAQARPSGIAGDDAQGIESFEKAIRPVLVERCSRCHGAAVAKPKGGLAFGTRAEMLQGGDSGPAIVPGDPDSSLLIRAIRYTDESRHMPPKGRLAPEEVAALEAWVLQGAPMPDPAPTPGTSTPAMPVDHWAFRPPRDPTVPAKGPGENPIDAFLRAGLERRGLSRAPPADRRTLIRRVTFDLTGLPPSPGEIEAFVTDRSPDAFARVVDRLLASPRYDERWARHWLDLVRRHRS